MRGKEDPSEIFSMRADSWKRIQDPPFSIVFDSVHPALLNEALHWISMGDIVAFDLAKEEFRVMPCPVVDDGRPQPPLVASFRGCLCVLFVPGDTDVGSLDLWIMREYGVAESWTKLFNLKVSDFAKEMSYFGPHYLGE
ncbi:F-box protein CPR1-like [Argentina anserina]|uniref:F-box protein CPR1-like n=1 Tax=Argentina anserina TaxID=57926 RepID=UPI0021764F36|nr:F-box protein CPR1-like [Potentilla anserina]